MNPKLAIGLAAGAGIASGIAIGYFSANKKAEMKWRKIADEEIESVKDTYHFLKGDGKYADPEVAAAAFRERSGYLERLDELQYLAATEEAERNSDTLLPADSGSESSSRADGDDGSSGSLVDYTKIGREVDGASWGVAPREIHIPKEPSNPTEEVVEIKLPPRREDRPFIVSSDEFFNDDQDYETITITYYEGDEILADDRDEVIYDIDGTIGVGTIDYFGHDKDDPNTIYVRNHKVEANYEVILDKGSYSKEVLGVDLDNGD